MQLEFFVKWKGYPSSDNTWEPYSNFDPVSLDNYLAKANIEPNENFRGPTTQIGSDDDDDDDDEVFVFLRLMVLL